MLLLTKKRKIENRENKIRQGNVVKLLWQQKRVKRSNFYVAKLYASFIFECVKMKNTEAYKPTIMVFYLSIFRLLKKKGSTENLRKEDEFKLTRKI